MRVLVTGAGGIIGKKLIEKIIDKIPEEIEFLVAVDAENIPPGFQTDTEKIWVQQNLWEADETWWHQIISSNDITRIIYLETIENNNEYIPTRETLNKFKLSDNIFTNYVLNIVQIPEANKLEVIYLSTDRIYYKDEYPVETNNMIIFQPDGNAGEFTTSLEYASNKITTELSLLGAGSIVTRIIRPFSIVSEDYNDEWPLIKTIKKAILEEDLECYSDGKTGLTFTYVDDLARFILSDKLFDPQIKLTLSNRIINMCRTQNYLPENYLLKKIVEKTESESFININSSINNFEFIMKTPQTRNQIRIYRPFIPIDIIIEKIYKKLYPYDKFAELKVNHIGYLPGSIFNADGEAEPGGSVVLWLDEGTMYTADVSDTGYWYIRADEPTYYTDPQKAYVYAMALEVQYQTVVVDVPPSEEPPH
jgi:nucleoside-diphosphate-sugar epimerase